MFGYGTVAGPFPSFTTTESAGTLISTIIGFFTVVAGLFVAWQIVAGGLQYISSSGDEKLIQRAQKKISFAIIGLIIIVGLHGFIWVLGNLLGIDILNPTISTS